MSILIKNGAGADVTLKSTPDAGEEVPHHRIDGTVNTGLNPLTDAQLRAAAVPVLTGLTPLTDLQLRATPVPVSLASSPLPSGAATETTLAALNAKVPPAGQNTMANSQPVVIASNQSSIPVSEVLLVLTGAAAQTATVNNILETPSGATATNVENLRSATVQVISTGTAGTFIFEQSNDNSNWVALPIFNAALVTGVPITAAITATASQIIYTIPLRCRFLRLRIVSTITGGSIQAFSRISTEPWTASVQLIASNTAANLNATIASPTIAAGANAIGDVGVQYRASTAGAGTFTNLNCPATPAVQTIKASAGRLIGIYLVNTNATIRYLKVFNIVSPTLASSTASLRIPLPQNQPIYISFEGGLAFGTAITCAICSTASLTDATGAVTLDDVTGFSVHA